MLRRAPQAPTGSIPRRVGSTNRSTALGHTEPRARDGSSGPGTSDQVHRVRGSPVVRLLDELEAAG